MSARLRAVAPRGLLVLALLAIAGGLGIAPATAQITGGCSATVAGQDANSAHNARNAIEVGEKDAVVVTGNAPGPITGYTIYMKFGPIRFPVADGTVSSGETSYTRTVNVDQYAKYGVGLYRVDGETSGTSCTGWAYVKVTGRSPLTTVAGLAGTAMLVGGAVGMGLSWPRKPKVGSGAGAVA